MKRIGIANPWVTFTFECPFFPAGDLVFQTLHFSSCAEFTSVLTFVLSRGRTGGSLSRWGKQGLELVLSNSSALNLAAWQEALSLLSVGSHPSFLLSSPVFWQLALWSTVITTFRAPQGPSVAAFGFSIVSRCLLCQNVGQENYLLSNHFSYYLFFCPFPDVSIVFLILRESSSVSLDLSLLRCLPSFFFFSNSCTILDRKSVV